MSLKRTATAILTMASLALLTGVLGACHKSSASPATTVTGPLPAASDLLTQAGTAMGNVQTVHFTIAIDGTLPNLPLKSADGVLTHAGEAKGTAKISELGSTIEAQFVVVGDSFYFNIGTGYQKLPLASATSIYDPSAILDPNRGIPKIITSAQNAKTVGAETIDGKTAYQVSLTPDSTAVANLIPGMTGQISGSVWIDKDSGHVVKAVFSVPSGGKTVAATLTFDNYDAPVTISAP